MSQSPSALSISMRVVGLRVDVEGRKIAHFGIESLARMLIDVEIDIIFGRSLCHSIRTYSSRQSAASMWSGPAKAAQVGMREVFSLCL